VRVHKLVVFFAVYRVLLERIPFTFGGRLVDWERPRIRRYNNADQQVAFTGDKGFEFVPQMVEKELIWGRV